MDAGNIVHTAGQGDLKIYLAGREVGGNNSLQPMCLAETYCHHEYKTKKNTQLPVPAGNLLGMAGGGVVTWTIIYPLVKNNCPLCKFSCCENKGLKDHVRKTHQRDCELQYKCLVHAIIQDAHSEKGPNRQKKARLSIVCRLFHFPALSAWSTIVCYGHCTYL
jgi:hypothetical protein